MAATAWVSTSSNGPRTGVESVKKRRTVACSGWHWTPEAAPGTSLQEPSVVFGRSGVRTTLRSPRSCRFPPFRISISRPFRPRMGRSRDPRSCPLGMCRRGGSHPARCSDGFRRSGSGSGASPAHGRGPRCHRGGRMGPASPGVTAPGSGHPAYPACRERGHRTARYGAALRRRKCCVLRTGGACRSTRIWGCFWWECPAGAPRGGRRSTLRGPTTRVAGP